MRASVSFKKPLQPSSYENPGKPVSCNKPIYCLLPNVMTRIAILSDAHGNLPALEAVLNDLADFRPDQIIYAGDFLRGPFPNEIIELLQSVNAAMIIGNDDQHTLRYHSGQCPPKWHTHKQYSIVRWTAAELTAENYTFLCSLPEQRSIHIPSAGAIRVVHGSPRSPSESLDPNRDPTLIDSAMECCKEPVLICGHTHRQWSLHKTGKLLINPGAVAGTQIGPYAQYARLLADGREWQVEMRTIPYDFVQLKSAFEQHGLLDSGDPISRGFLLSMQTGYDFMVAFLRFAYALAAENGIDRTQVIPDEIWDQADRMFRWEIPKT